MPRLAPPRLALVTAITSLSRDHDMSLLQQACARAGIAAEVRAWDDGSVSWARYDAALLRSCWDYTTRLPGFLAWCDRTAVRTRLWNPPEIVRWNTDKRYLADLAADGIAVVPTAYADPDDDPLAAVEALLAAHPDAAECVVKPTVAAGAAGARRYARAQSLAAADHLGRLLGAGRSAMLQPYLPAIDRDGETALLYFGGRYSHAIRKAALLRPDSDSPDAATRDKAISARTPGEDERRFGDGVLDALARRFGSAPLYARVDLLRDADGRPRLLELELTEPTLFLPFAEGAADRLAVALRGALAEPGASPSDSPGGATGAGSGPIGASEPSRDSKKRR